MRNPLLVALACAALLAGQATAQMLPRPREVQPRVLDWNATFPVTPPFRDWTDVFEMAEDDGRPVGRIWLHADSLRWVSTSAGPMLRADLLYYFDGRGGHAIGYHRAIVVLGCGHATRMLTHAANARVLVTPEGRIAPMGDVREDWATTYVRVTTPTWYDSLCNDSTLRNRFLRQ